MSVPSKLSPLSRVPSLSDGMALSATHGPANPKFVPMANDSRTATQESAQFPPFAAMPPLSEAMVNNTGGTKAHPAAMAASAKPSPPPATLLQLAPRPPTLTSPRSARRTSQRLRRTSPKLLLEQYVPYVSPRFAGPKSVVAKVHGWLQDVAVARPDLVHWTADGRAFDVERRSDELAPFIQQHFGFDSFDSLRRKLNKHGFRVLASGEFQGSFYHPYFRREWNTSEHFVLVNRENATAVAAVLGHGRRTPGDHLPTPPLSTREEDRNQTVTPDDLTLLPGPHPVALLCPPLQAMAIHAEAAIKSPLVEPVQPTIRATDIFGDQDAGNGCQFVPLLSPLELDDFVVSPPTDKTSFLTETGSPSISKPAASSASVKSTSMSYPSDSSPAGPPDKNDPSTPLACQGWPELRVFSSGSSAFTPLSLSPIQFEAIQGVPFSPLTTVKGDLMSETVGKGGRVRTLDLEGMGVVQIAEV